MDQNQWKKLLNEGKMLLEQGPFEYDSFSEMERGAEFIADYIQKKVGKAVAKGDYANTPFLSKRGAWIEKKLFWKNKYPRINYVQILGEIGEKYFTIKLNGNDDKVLFVKTVKNKGDLDKLIQNLKTYQ